MPDVTANLDPQTEQLRQLLRKSQARRGEGGANGSEAIAKGAQEVDIALLAINDDLFVDAPTQQARLRRLNQIRNGNGLTELLQLPDDLKTAGFIENLKSKVPEYLDKLVQAGQSGAENTSVGLVRAIVNDELPEEPPDGIGFRVLSEVTSLVFDPITYLSGGLGNQVAKQAAKKIGVEIAKTGLKATIKRSLVRGVGLGATLAGLTAVRDPLGQQANTGEIDVGQTAIRTAESAALGFAAGGAGAIGGKVIGAGLEIGTFATGGAALEGRLPTTEDFILSAGTILTLRATGAAREKIGGTVARRLGTAISKKASGEQLSAEDRAVLEQTPKTIQDRIEVDVKGKNSKTTDHTLTKDFLLTEEGARELQARHPDVANAIANAPNASQKNFGPLKSLLPDVGKTFDAPERNQLRAFIKSIQGEPVVPVAPAKKTGGTSFKDFLAKKGIDIKDIRADSDEGKALRTEFQKSKTPQLETADPLPEPGKKLDAIQEAVVKDAQKAPKGIPPEELPVVPLEETTGARRKGLNPAKKLYRWLRTGGQHETVVSTKTTADALVNSFLRQSEFTLAAYRQGVRKAYGLLGRVPEGELAKINAVLKDNAPGDTLPDSVRGPVQKMRTDIDSLAQQLIRAGAVQGEMEAIFTGNLGTYMHRSYRIFRIDPKRTPRFIDRLSAADKNKAVAYFRGELEDSLGRKPTAEESQSHLEAFLYSTAKRGSALEAASSARLGAKELGILNFRKDIPKEIRAIWGEDTDPRVQYANTIAAQGRLLASTKRLAQLREQGMGKFLFEQPKGEFIAEINDGTSQPLYPLTQGKPLFTTPEYENAMRTAFSPGANNPAVLKAYYWLNAAVKAGKTAFSVQGINRNFFGNPMIALANGHLNPWRALQAARTTGTDVLPGVFDFLKLSNRAQKETVQRLIELKVINASSRSGELRAVIKDAESAGSSSAYIENTALRLAAIVPKKFIDFFRAGDDFYHVNAFNHELAALKRAYPNAPIDSLEVRAAKKVVSTYPTYSEAPHAIQEARKAIILGDFVTFPAEMVRTTVNIPRLIAEELAIPEERAIGIRRAMGFIAMGTTAIGLTKATRMLTGITEKEEEAMRVLAPDWMQNSVWGHLGRKDKDKFEVVDAQYSMPQAFMVAPIIAALRGENPQEATEGAVREIIRPFVNEAILFGTARDLIVNERRSSNSTRNIFNPEAGIVDQTKDIAAFLVEKLEPGTTRSIDRIVKGVQNKPLRTGTIPDPETEALAVLSGQRAWTIDVPRDLGFKARNLTRRRDDARDIFFTSAFARDGRDEPEIQDAYDKAVNADRALFSETQGIISAAKTLGQTDKEVKAVLSDKRVDLSERTIERLMNGVHDPDAILRSVVWSLSGKDFDERVPLILKALGVSQGEAREFLIEEMRERGYKTVPVIRISRLQRRLE